MKRLIAQLKASGAELLRTTKHHVWRLPNGQKFTAASTPSDWRAEKNQLTDLRHALGEVPVHQEGERREKRHKPGREVQARLTPTVNTTLADKLRLIGVAEDSLREKIADLEKQLARALADAEGQRVEQLGCPGCMFRAWRRRAWRAIKRTYEGVAQ